MSGANDASDDGNKLPVTSQECIKAFSAFIQDYLGEIDRLNPNGKIELAEVMKAYSNPDVNSGAHSRHLNTAYINFPKIAGLDYDSSSISSKDAEILNQKFEQHHVARQKKFETADFFSDNFDTFTERRKSSFTFQGDVVPELRNGNVPNAPSEAQVKTMFDQVAGSKTYPTDLIVRSIDRDKIRAFRGSTYNDLIDSVAYFAGARDAFVPAEAGREYDRMNTAIYRAIGRSAKDTLRDFCESLITSDLDRLEQTVKRLEPDELADYARTLDGLYSTVTGIGGLTRLYEVSVKYDEKDYKFWPACPSLVIEASGKTLHVPMDANHKPLACKGKDRISPQEALHRASYEIRHPIGNLRIRR